jgi:DNA invertase Pin-like site-specific DNA recombinase
MVKSQSKQTAQSVAYSYIRFSHPDQARGDSLRRQAEKRDAWLKRHGVALDTSLSMEDRGVSGFTGEHRTNADRHALAAFLELVKRGRIAKGSYLIVESLDRLSREHIRPALTLLLNLIDSGVRVVQLLPVEAVYDEAVEPMQLMMAIMELSRGNSESAMKSERVGGAWQDKKRRAAENGEPLTARAPNWLRLAGGKWEIVEEAADTIRQIYRWAIEGHGTGAITKRLNAGNFPPIGRDARPADQRAWPRAWGTSYVAKILGNRAVVGEYQPYKGRAGKRRPDGQPIAGYYPVVVDEQTWDAARGAMASRRNKAGREAKHTVNLFANLLRDARNGGTFFLMDKGKRGSKILASYKAAQGVNGAGKFISFPFTVFEHSVLSRLREIDPREVLPKNDPSGDKVLLLSGRLEQVDGRLERIKAKLLDGGDIEVLAEAARELEGKRKDVADALARARREAASPAMEAWGQAKSLIDVLDKAPDPEEARVRLRAVIRRVVDQVWLLVVARGNTRACVAQFWFKDGGRHRDYLIIHRRALGGMAARQIGGDRSAQTSVEDLASVVKAGDLDLRKRDHAARLEKALAAVELGPKGGGRRPRRG